MMNGCNLKEFKALFFPFPLNDGVFDRSALSNRNIT